MLKDIFIVYIYTGAYRTGNRYIEEVFDTEAAAENYVSQQSIPKIMKLKNSICIVGEIEMSENAKKFIQNSRLVLTVFVVEKLLGMVNLTWAEVLIPLYILLIFYVACFIYKLFTS
mgnify:CR=1 FL=1